MSWRILVNSINTILAMSIVGVLGFVFMFWVAFGGVGFLDCNPPSPTIKHGEFPFRLVYELDGQMVEVKDILICDFDGFGWNEASGKFRKWKSHLKSSNTRITLVTNAEIEIFYAPNINHYAAATYYMGDTAIYSGANDSFPKA